MISFPRETVKVVFVVVVAACASTVESSESPATVAPVASTLPAPTTAPTATSPSATTTTPTTVLAPTSSTSSTSTPSTSTLVSTTSTLAPLPPLTAPPGPTTTVPPELNPCPPNGEAKFKVRPPVPWDVPEVPAGWVQRLVGTSVLGRDIIALVRPAVGEPQHQVIVIGSIHGNEVTNVPTVRSMVSAEVPDDVELWLIPDANPDGTAIGTRCNANGVDLNRNFDWEWAAHDGGPAPMSEPETRALADLIITEWPDLVVWVHQPLRYVAAIGPSDPVHARAWAKAAELQLRTDITQHGGAESWTAFVAGRPSILLEVQDRDLSDDLVDAHVDGLSAALAAFP